jgi:hypothetical protein
MLNSVPTLRVTRANEKAGDLALPFRKKGDQFFSRKQMWMLGLKRGGVARSGDQNNGVVGAYSRTPSHLKNNQRLLLLEVRRST